MKKILAILLTAAMALGMAACADSGEKKNSEGGDVSPVELLQKVWDSYGEEEKFSAAGGDMSEENMNMEGPGKYGLDDAEAIDAVLGLPASALDKIDSAASLVHMMNANTFTCGAFHVKDKKDISALADELKENITTRQWMCGFPDKLVIVSASGCVVSFFGNEEIVNLFMDKLKAAYSDAEVISEEPLI